MSMKFRPFLAVGAAILFVGCSTAATGTAEKKPDARQGESVRNICFSQQIRGWRPEGRDSVIVEAAGRQEYKLDLIGGCQPNDAFTSIGLISRVGGGSCLEAGDKLITDQRYGGVCMISKIYKWNKDAAKPDAAAPS